MQPRIFRYESVDSTNDVARRLIADGVIASSACVVAREQTHGRGTHGRCWISPKDAGIYLSVVELPEADLLPATSEYTTAVGCACADCLRRETGVDVRLQGVNDLFVGSRKLGGILTEALMTRERIDALIVGVGINVRRANRALPAGASGAVSLEEVLPAARWKTLDTETLTCRVIEAVRSAIWFVSMTPRPV